MTLPEILRSSPRKEVVGVPGGTIVVIDNEELCQQILEALEGEVFDKSKNMIHIDLIRMREFCLGEKKEKGDAPW